jgi:superkiller protein 3
MLGLVIVVFFGSIAVSGKMILSGSNNSSLPIELTTRLDKLWQIAQEALNDKKYLRAEKALLMILHVDEKNASAYNRLGILYAKQKEYSDAIECFEIAQSLEPSATSLHNVGLIYYETGDYEKSAIAFEQALSLDDKSSARLIAYAQTQEKLGNHKKEVELLEKAIKIELHNNNKPTPKIMNMIADAYEKTGKKELADRIHEKLARLILTSQNTSVEKNRKDKVNKKTETNKKNKLVM